MEGVGLYDYPLIMNETATTAYSKQFEKSKW
jgi:hypothetical protein